LLYTIYNNIYIYIYYIFILISYIGWSFQQDNSKIHKKQNVLDWFKRYKIKLFIHPAYSPDLNPIENIWSLLKDRLDKRFNGSYSRSKSTISIEAFKIAIQEEWALIDQEAIDKCILSLLKRWQAIIDAKGYPTKY
jgi:transposase